MRVIALVSHAQEYFYVQCVLVTQRRGFFFSVITVRGIEVSVNALLKGEWIL